MTVFTIARYTIHCDAPGCSRWLRDAHGQEVEFATPTKAERLARNLGWTVKGLEHRCPQHVKEQVS